LAFSQRKEHVGSSIAPQLSIWARTRREKKE